MKKRIAIPIETSRSSPAGAGLDAAMHRQGAGIAASLRALRVDWIM